MPTVTLGEEEDMGDHESHIPVNMVKLAAVPKSIYASSRSKTASNLTW